MPRAQPLPLQRPTGMTRSDRSHAPVDFTALEYRSDDRFQSARYAFREAPGEGWRVEREGRPHLALGPGYTLLRSRVCGVCSTDLDRRFLPFPLPQITGHEVVAEDAAGRRHVVEINASHAARGEPPCAFCRAGLATHCPSRLVLGIHDLPGGFGPWLLAPHGALVPVPASIPDDTAALVEPFAAALHAVTTIDPPDDATVAVLGPRRLGLLVVAALAAHRRHGGRRYEIVALARRAALRDLACALGADRAERPPDDPAEATAIADVVVDTTGSPDGLALAAALARREVHLKSTHGQPALGCAHLTEAVVDEIALRAVADADGAGWRALFASVPRCAARDRLRVGWIGDVDAAPDWPTDGVEIVRAAGPEALLAALEDEGARPAGAPGGDVATLPRVDVLVLDDARGIDAALRPVAGREVSPLRPRGELVLRTGLASGLGSGSAAQRERPAIADVLERGVRISTSRCGSFAHALRLIESDDALRGLGRALVTHRLDATSLEEAFEVARSSDAIKVLVEHGVQASLHAD